MLLHGWLLLLTLAVLGMAVACLKYCATNRVNFQNYDDDGNNDGDDLSDGSLP